MTYRPTPLINRMILLYIVIFQFSCAKDSDLLADYVISETQDAINISNVAVDDSFQVFSNTAMVLDVLSNDTFENPEEVSITETSTPNNGTVVINDDNTLTYTPNTDITEQVADGEVVDTFTYNTEAPDANGSILPDTGSVTIKAGASGNYLFTTEAKKVLKERFEKGYVTAPGFSDDITRCLASVAEFKKDPSAYRPTYGLNGSNGTYSPRQIMFHSALYAYVMDDVTLANMVITELLTTVNTNDMSASWWDGDKAWLPTIDFSTQYSGWELSASIGKYMFCYDALINIQTVLSTSEEAQIETWFDAYMGHATAWFDAWFDNYWGADWENRGLTKFGGENLYSLTSYSTPYPIEDAHGNPNMDYVMTGAQNQFNNRIVETVALIHSWAVRNNNLTYEHATREWFKNAIKYGLFPDGTFWELIRNENIYNFSELGVWYSYSTLNAMVRMAHEDAMAGHYPNDLLYDYETTEGVVKGSTNITSIPYLGSSTTDGVTLKSLKTFIIAQSKYYRSSANGGWGDIRYYGGSPIDMTGQEERDYSISQAIANLYYKDDDIYKSYVYDQSAGYPQKDSFNEGSYYNGEDGVVGTCILGAAWFEMENYYFN